MPNTGYNINNRKKFAPIVFSLVEVKKDDIKSVIITYLLSTIIIEGL